MILNEKSYRKAFFVAVFFHLCLGFMLLNESSSPRPVLTKETKNQPGETQSLEMATKPEPEIIKAVSVNNQEVMETVNRLKNERAMQIKKEQARQNALTQQAEKARAARVLEQHKLAQLKDEAAKVAIARKKQIEDEQQHLKQLALQKEQETKHLEALKKQQEVLQKKQQEDTLKLAALQKKKATEEAQASKERAEKAEAAKAQQRKNEEENTAKNAQQKAKIAGEVDKYKALIVNAISRRWILPENVDSRLSSQFRIRLAPDGAVLEVSLTRSSGDAILDRSAQTAIYKASPLPVPNDPTTFNLFRDISLTVRPENVRG